MRLLVLVPMVWLTACAGGAAGPVAIDTRHDTCGQCRMIVSDVRLAAQIVAPGDEARVFDDIGCLRDYLALHPPAADAMVFVADHRTGEWIEARSAIYTRTRSVYTPMGSRIVAHGSAKSRDADPVVSDGDPVPASALFEPVHAGAGAHEWESQMEPLLQAGGTE